LKIHRLIDFFAGPRTYFVNWITVVFMPPPIQ